MKRKPFTQLWSLMIAGVMLIGLLPSAAIPVFAVEESDIYAEDPNYEHGYFLGGRGYWEGGTWVREVYDWDDMDQVFEKLDSASMVNYGYVTVKLMENLELTSADSDLYDGYFKRYIIPAGLNNVIFDFNGHTLSGTNADSNSKNFIKMEVREGNHVTFTDSVGGGGITFDATYSNTDLDISALYIYTIGKRGEGYNTEDPNSYPAKVTFNDGTYKLIGEFTYIGNDSRLSAPSSYIGTVIADYVDVEINGGTFIADNTSDEEDACELSAFGTIIRNDEVNGFPEDQNPEYGTVIPFVEKGHTVINGGSFISDGYAFHHFDNCQTYLDNGIYDYYYWHNAYYVYCVGLNSHFHMNYPTINGGYFEGQLGFTGLTLTDSEGDSDLNSRPASEIIPKTACFVGVDRDGNKSYDITNWTWDDLHDMQKCTVVSSELFEFKVTHEGTSNLTNLTRTVKQSDTFEMSWTIPSYLEGEVVCQPMIIVTRPNSDIEPKTYTKSKITLDYSEYPNDVNIRFGLYIFVEGEDALLQQAAYLCKDFRVDVKRVYTVTDNCLHCYVTGDNGWDEIVEGETCAFVILPNEYYELTDPDALEVYVNGEPITPSENGGYYVSNVTEDLDIYCDGSAFTSFSNLTVTANGKTVTEKIFDGGTYTFKTLAEFGVAVPENSTFTGWKIGGNAYQPGETYTVPGGGEIKINAAFTGLYSITVENGKAYADEAHTIPISAAAEDQVIYIVADPAPEGKVFSYWSHQIATAGGGGSFGNYDAAQTTYKVYYSDVVLTPVYETQIDNIVINGMTKPSAGVAIDNSDYSYKWGCSVPADAGYSLGICYWYDITDGEPEQAMSDGDVFQIGHTYRFKARIHLKADHIYPANPEDIAVVLSGIDAEDYQCTINEVGYTSATIFFEFTCEREEPDTALICPKGDGTSSNPFQITNIGELYWFAAFVNGTASYPDGVTVERSEACAIVMNDITVNPGVLTEDGELNGTSGFAQWTPIAPPNGYKGTFDGQGHTISGIYCAPQAAADYRYGGFFRSLFKGGCIRDLTLADSYFRAPAKNSAYTGAFAGYIASYCTVENCHFDGTVTTAITADSSDADKETYQYVKIAGIAGDVVGEIRDCTARGLISGYGSEIGGIASYVYNGEVAGCVNEATVETPNNSGDIGGIVGRLYKGIIRDCRNKGNVIGRSSAGIVSNVEDKTSAVIRSWNEGDIEGPYGSGIVLSLMGSVKNCYNTGSVDEAGIAGTAYSGSSVTYCHNVGEITGYMGAPICSVSSGSNITIENCYYLADSETDVLDGTTYKTADQFADGTVLALLNNGHWTQGEDDEYPVLAVPTGVTVSGTITSFGSETDDITIELYAEGSTSADYTATVQSNTAEYSIEDVAAGTYTMKVKKNDHVGYEYILVVEAEDVDHDVEMWLLGDANSNGEVSISDAVMILRVLADQLSIENINQAAANVHTAEAEITLADATLILKYLLGEETL